MSARTIYFPGIIDQMTSNQVIFVHVYSHAQANNPVIQVYWAINATGHETNFSDDPTGCPTFHSVWLYSIFIEAIYVYSPFQLCHVVNQELSMVPIWAVQHMVRL